MAPRIYSTLLSAAAHDKLGYSAATRITGSISLTIALLLSVSGGVKTLAANVNAKLARPYPLVWSDVKKFSDVKEDDEGIPLLEHDGADVYYPIRISLIALTYYAHYVSSQDSASREEFLKLAEWMLANFEERGSYGGWYTDNPLRKSEYNLPDKWLSALSQGTGLSVMVGGHSLTGNARYLEVAATAIKAFHIGVAEGGIAAPWGSSVWYDEYPSAPEKHVLNGFIFALAGLYEYHCYTGNEVARELFNQGVASLREHLPRFDSGFNSYYSQSNNQTVTHGIASATGGKYHDLHIAQLLWVYAATGDDYFKDWAHRFLKQDFGDTRRYDVPNQYRSISASKSVEPIEFGPDNLHDGNWTYGNYWSTTTFPAELLVEFQRPVSDLSTFFLVSTGEKIPESTFEASVFDGSAWASVEFKLVDSHPYKTRHFKSLAMTYELAGAAMEGIEKFKITFHDEKWGILKLREVNFSYDMSPELDGMIAMLGYKQCSQP